uniref:NodB homology domain-containing protein n=1 Tax=Odontella aurita TaxID=265563 RepID=A0A7S4N3Z4_9STRA
MASASSASASVAVVGYLLPEADGMERQRPPHSPKESVAASTPMKAYHLRRQGNCLDSITSLEECQIAASILLLSTRRAVSDDDGDGHGGGAPWYPPGCYSHRGNALRFNSPPVPPPAAVGAAGADAKPPNTGKCSPALPCLCRGPTNASSPSRVKISASISPWNGRRAALSSTWDDGSDSQVTFVPTLLGSYNLSGTFYLSPQFLDPVDDRPTPDVLPNKWEYARRNYFPNAEEEWGKTAVVRHEVAAHTLSHSRFDDPTMTGEDASRDFAEVDRRLEAEFSSLLLQPLSMSWPFGVYHPEALRAARDHGYASGRTTKCGYIPWGIEPENDWLTLPSCELIGNDDDHHRVMIQKAIDGVIDDDDNGKKKKKKNANNGKDPDKRKRRYKGNDKVPREAGALVRALTHWDHNKRTTVRAAKLYPWVNPPPYAAEGEGGGEDDATETKHSVSGGKVDFLKCALEGPGPETTKESKKKEKEKEREANGTAE